MVRLITAAPLLVWLSAGCAPEYRDNPRYLPAKIPAIQEAVQRRDLSVAPQLVKDLESTDPAVRFYAIEALERLTDQTFGYVYYDEPSRRMDAVVKWKRWLKDQNLK